MPIAALGSSENVRWTRAYEDIIKKAIAKVAPEYVCHRADENARPEEWWPSVIEHLCQDDICVVDVTGQNPNVYFELGIRFTIADRTIVVTQSMDDVKADIYGYNVLVYSEDPSRNSGFETKLRQAFEDIQSNREKIRNSVRKYLTKWSPPSEFEKVLTPAGPVENLPAIWKGVESQLADLGCVRLGFPGFPAELTPFVSSLDDKNALVCVTEPIVRGQRFPEFFSGFQNAFVKLASVLCDPRELNAYLARSFGKTILFSDVDILLVIVPCDGWVPGSKDLEDDLKEMYGGAQDIAQAKYRYHNALKRYRSKSSYGENANMCVFVWDSATMKTFRREYANAVASAE